MLNTAQWETKTLNVTSIMLDELNIRLEDVHPSQEAIIQDLFTNYKTFDLVKSILQHGLFNHELPIVIKEDDKWTVLEGNRRVAALRTILNPKLVPQYENRIKELLKSAGDISTLHKIEVKKAISRDSASQVVATIHTVRSRIPWRPLRQAYFYYAQIESGKKTVKQLRKDYPEADIPRFVKMWEMHRIAKSVSYDDDQTKQKVDSQNFPISTFERLYDNDIFRKKAKISFDDNGQVIIHSHQEDLKELIKKVVTDIVDRNIDSRILNRKDASEAKKYINELGDLGKSGDKTIATDYEPAKQSDQKRKHLVPDYIVCTLSYPAINKMLNELKKIPWTKYPNASHDLLRTFLECSLKAYFEEQGMTPSAHLSSLITQAIKHFDTVQRSLVQPLKVIQGSGPYLHSQDFLNATNHNHNTFAVGKNVEDAWDQMESVLKYILSPPAANDTNKNP
ncbi:MAG TPA: hypothetical protein VIJ14_05915 [Rhabdochlamydiaceae bacterium]